jgi:hypothetical protein
MPTNRHRLRQDSSIDRNRHAAAVSRCCLAWSGDGFRGWTTKRIAVKGMDRRDTVLADVALVPGLYSKNKSINKAVVTTLCTISGTAFL